MAKSKVPAIHMRDSEGVKCGAHLSPNAVIVDDKDAVTCKNCLAVVIAEEKNKDKYPYLVLTRKSAILHISDTESDHVHFSEVDKYEIKAIFDRFSERAEKPKEQRDE